MTVFNVSDFDNHEQVVFCCDEKVGLKAIIAIHNTNLGPALGGCRFWNYEQEEDALRDVLRLSRGMTYKAALANLKLGGGKSVIIGDAKTQKTPELLARFGEFVERLNGIYITAEDVNTSPEDMSVIHSKTEHVVGLQDIEGGSGDPSVLTAYGTIVSMQACILHRLGTASMDGVHVVIQGLGHVGKLIAEDLHKKGARLTITDINKGWAEKIAEQLGATYVDPDGIYDIKGDVFAPCALGGIINDQTIERLKCPMIVGCANNQLAEKRHGAALKEAGVLYAPDYVVNAGGLINVTYEGKRYNLDTVLEHVNGIRGTLLEILEISEAENISTNAASDRLAEQRFLAGC